MGEHTFLTLPEDSWNANNPPEKEGLMKSTLHLFIVKTNGKPINQRPFLPEGKKEVQLNRTRRLKAEFESLEERRHGLLSSHMTQMTHMPHMKNLHSPLPVAIFLFRFPYRLYDRMCQSGYILCHVNELCSTGSNPTMENLLRFREITWKNYYYYLS